MHIGVLSRPSPAHAMRHTHLIALVSLRVLAKQCSNANDSASISLILKEFYNYLLFSLVWAKRSHVTVKWGGELSTLNALRGISLFVKVRQRKKEETEWQRDRQKEREWESEWERESTTCRKAGQCSSWVQISLVFAQTGKFFSLLQIKSVHFEVRQLFYPLAKKDLASL